MEEPPGEHAAGGADQVARFTSETIAARKRLGWAEVAGGDTRDDVGCRKRLANAWFMRG